MTYKPSGDTVLKDSRRSQFTVAGFSNTFTVHLDTGSVAADTAFMLIDLSDTTNWAHTNTGHIVLEYIIIEISPDTTYLGDIEIGFLTNVDGDNGDFNQLIGIHMEKKSDLLVQAIDFGSHGIECQTTHHFGPITADSTLFQTDVNLLGPDGNASFPSGANDLVMFVGRSAGTVDVGITLGYETSA